MKPYKATLAGSFANCVYKFNADLLVPCLGPIYCALDDLEYYPEGWNHINSIVLCKLGKTNYTNPTAYHPVCLMKDHACLYHTAKTMQLTVEVERAGILPSNHYGARPGHAAMDTLHAVVKIVKGTWRKGEVASVLCMDVKGPFPSVNLDHLVHNMRKHGVPRQHTDWMRKYKGQTSHIVFDNYTSEAFKVDGGLDQGDPALGISYLIYNSDLAEIPLRQKKAGEAGVIYVDNNTMVVTGLTFEIRHRKLEDMASRQGGVDGWEVDHNTRLGWLSTSFSTRGGAW
jgi:hypothetical protein